MTIDPAREERVERVHRHMDMHWGGKPIGTEAMVAEILEEADAIEPVAVYLTAEEREALLYDNVIDAAARKGARLKLRAAQERGEKP